MKMQRGLCEMEYGVKIDLKGKKEDDIEKSEDKRNEEVKRLNQPNNYIIENEKIDVNNSEQQEVNHTVKEKNINDTEEQLSDEHHIAAKTEVIKIEQPKVLVLKDSSSEA